MKQLPFYYCYFHFRTSTGNRHELRVRVTETHGLTWGLYIDDMHAGTFHNTAVNTLDETQLNAALSYGNVLKVYNQLLNPNRVMK